MITYPLNNIDYTAEDAELYFSTRKSGVHDGEDFEITVSGIDNNVTVGEGIAWIRNTKFSGKVAALKEPKTLTLDLADSVYDRIDAIVIQFDASKNGSDVIVKKGTASSAPVAPSVLQTESLYELHIGHVYRKAGATTIGVIDVIDQRRNPDYCGIMFDPVAAIDETLSKRGFAADAEAVGTAIENSKGGMTLLWKNASPTSNFATQTISLDLSEYQLVAIEYRFKTDIANMQVIIGKVGATVILDVISSGGYVGIRAAITSETGVKFNNAHYNGNDNVTGYIVPTAIYGIKGVT